MLPKRWRSPTSAPISPAVDGGSDRRGGSHRRGLGSRDPSPFFMDTAMALRPGSTFRGSDPRPAGHIFFVPGEERPGNDPKNRPCFLINRCDPAADPYALGTLAYMSTKSTEIVQFGCAGHEIGRPRSADESGDEGNFVITARLLPRAASALNRSRFSAVDEVHRVRKSVLQALAIGEGMGGERNGSVRGRLVRVLDDGVGASSGFILTAHDYSAQRRYQVVVPIIDRIFEDEDGFEKIELNRWDVVPERQPWFRGLALREPLIDTAGLVSLTEEWRKSRDPRTWLDRQIEVTGTMIDQATLAEVEAKITERLLL
jgi:hypothetical protein